QTYLGAAERSLSVAGPRAPRPEPVEAPPASPDRGSFCSGRYVVRRFLGEGGKKRVYLAHDSKLDREIAFALIKTQGLDSEGQLPSHSARPHALHRPLHAPRTGGRRRGHPTVRPLLPGRHAL